MSTDLNMNCDPAGDETEMHRLSERVAQLEAENLQLEQVLQRNSRMFEALLANGREGITLTGPDRRIVRVINGLSGKDAPSLCGVPIDSLVVPEDRQVIVDAYRDLVQGGCGRIQFTIRVPGEDGAVGLFMATLTDMLDDPDVQGIVWNYSTYSYL